MENFIESVREAKFLWDSSDPRYKEQESKESHWAEISRQHNFPSGKAAKRQWKKLRDSFREALKRQKEWKNSAPPTAGDKKPWKYQQQMQFLIPYMKNRPSNAGHSTSQEQKIFPVSNFQTEEHYEMISSPISPQNPTSSPIVTKTIKSSNTEVISQQIIPHEERIELPILEKEKSPDELSGSDELKDFFSSMYLSTRNLPPIEQLRIKRVLFTAVTEAQERYMSRPTMPTPTTFVSYSSHSKLVSNDFQDNTNKTSYSQIHGINFIESHDAQDSAQLYTFKIED